MATRARVVAPFALAALERGSGAVAGPGLRLRPVHPARARCRVPPPRDRRAARAGSGGRHRSVSGSWSSRWPRTSCGCSWATRPRSGSRPLRRSRHSGAQLRGGWHLLRTAPAPARVTDGTLLLAVVATWTVATVADWLAFRRNATLAAVAPALVLFVWSSTLGTSSDETLTVAGFADRGRRVPRGPEHRRARPPSELARLRQAGARALAPPRGAARARRAARRPRARARVARRRERPDPRLRQLRPTRQRRPQLQHARARRSWTSAPSCRRRTTTRCSP